MQNPDWHPDISWLLSACSEQSKTHVRGVAVEPVTKYAKAMKTLASQHLQHVVVLEAAIGEEDIDDVDLYVIESPEELIEQVSRNEQADLKWHLSFLENMSCVGRAHSEFSGIQAFIKQKFNLQVNLVQQSGVKQLSWTSLVGNIGFKGCEVLAVDAEGFDASILRSMLKHCRENPGELPELIQFETRGHCDSYEKRNSEWEIIKSLQAAGYVLIALSHHDTHLVHRDALDRSQLWAWFESWICDSCSRNGDMDRIPFTWNKNWCWCKLCLDAEWRSTFSSEPSQ